MTGIVLTHYHPDPGPASDEMVSDNAAGRLFRRLARWAYPSTNANEWLTGSGQPAVRDFSSIGVSLGDGDHVPLTGPNIQVVETPGHTDGHICLYEPESGTFFSGDHVLPRISPHIALHPGGSGNPLADYYKSLEKLRRYTAAEVLPAHEYRFRGLLHRTAELPTQHEEPTAEIVQIFESRMPQNVWDAARRLTWNKRWDALHGYPMDFALTETAARRRFTLEHNQPQKRQSRHHNWN